MKTFNTVLLTAMLACTGSHAAAKEMVIAFSPYQQQNVAKAQATNILQFLTQLEPGDKAVLMDGFHLKTIGEFNIPESKAYNSPKARLNVNRKAVGALMRFAKNASGNAGEDTPSVAGALRLPQLLHHVAENYADTGAMDVIVLGSPFYDDPREPEFSMAGGLIPSDGHLNMTRAKSPFGTKGAGKFFANIRLHFGFGNEAVMQSDQHRFFVQRFWTLFVEQQGGEMVSFTGDRKVLLERVQRHAKAPKHDYKISDSTKLEMIRLRRETPARTIYERPVSRTPLKTHMLRHARGVEIGLTWDCRECDLDLYARASPDADVLYFNRTTSAQGTHWKDFRRSPQTTNGYETIAFHVPVDLRRLQIAINFYEGNALHGVKGELRMSVAGETYAMKFEIKTISGNKGKGVDKALQSGQSPNLQTLLINPLEVVRAQGKSP